MSSQKQQNKILLYYKYVDISDPEALKTQQKNLCQKLNLKGRILVSHEGINGTLAGLVADVDKYITETTKIPEFADIEWKVSFADEQVFPKLRVVVRDEIVTLGLKKRGSDVAISNKAHYIEPEELLSLYESNDEFLIIDARNAYEAEIGKFKNAVIPPIDNFREFPEYVKTIEKYKDKEVVTYCTGGVRCEKASAYLREQGFKKVRQLHGGVHVYAEKVGGKFFEGELFVFDKRLHTSVNKVDPSVISKCMYCEVPITRYIDCVGPACDGLFICCQKCQDEHLSACSAKCEDKIKKQTSLTKNPLVSKL